MSAVAQVAELVDALVSGTSGASREGSSPFLGTINLPDSKDFNKPNTREVLRLPIVTGARIAASAASARAKAQSFVDRAHEVAKPSKSVARRLGRCRCGRRCPTGIARVAAARNG